MRDDRLRLSDMLEALERIRGFAAGGRAAFLSDTKVNEAVAYEILKLGEAAGHLSPSFRRSHGKVPWRRLVGLRNQIIHEYFRVDPDDLWEFVAAELEGLERALRSLVPPPGR